MKTIIIQRITDLKKEQFDIRGNLVKQFESDTLTSESITYASNRCTDIDIRLSELNILLKQAEHFYGNKNRNIKQNQTTDNTEGIHSEES
jgi:hypothetical protein